jgi:hypothetical protein
VLLIYNTTIKTKGIKMKSNANEENDKIQRAGISALYKETKAKKSKQELLKDDEIKQKTLDFIFGKSEENPLQK